MKTLLLAISALLFSGCMIEPSGSDGDFGIKYSIKSQDYHFENAGLDPLIFKAEVYQSVSDDNCQKYKLEQSRELKPGEKDRVRLAMECRAATNLRRYLTVTNAYNGRELVRYKFLSENVRVTCDEIDCEVFCGAGQVCLIP